MKVLSWKGVCDRSPRGSMIGQDELEARRMELTRTLGESAVDWVSGMRLLWAGGH